MSARLFFFNDTATTEIYTLSLHDALPIYGIGKTRVPQRASSTLDVIWTRSANSHTGRRHDGPQQRPDRWQHPTTRQDRKSTRLNSSHANISYAVFCLKKINALLRPLVEYC